jgi:predicted site-specific integrase-resolvase
MILSMTQLPEHNPEREVPELLTAGEVGRLLGGISDETVNRWARDGKLACITLPSGARRFRRDVVDAILAGTPATTAESAA